MENSFEDETYQELVQIAENVEKLVNKLFSILNKKKRSREADKTYELKNPGQMKKHRENSSPFVFEAPRDEVFSFDSSFDSSSIDIGVFEEKTFSNFDKAEALKKFSQFQTNNKEVSFDSFDSSEILADNEKELFFESESSPEFDDSSVELFDSSEISFVGIENFNKKTEGFASYRTASNWREYVKVVENLDEHLLPQIEYKNRFINVGEYVIMENRISVWRRKHPSRRSFYLVRGHYMKLPE